MIHILHNIIMAVSMHIKFIGILIISLSGMVACSEQEQEKSASQLKHRSQFANETLLLGRNLYQLNCATCHGADASGTKNWRQRDAQGKFPPPPLNGTGHTWHHPTAILKELIMDGTAKTGGNMPAWRGKLSEQDVEAILSWLQTLWPQQAYDAWREVERRSLQP